MKKIFLIGAICAMIFGCSEVDELSYSFSEELIEVAVNFAPAGIEVATRGFLDDAVNMQDWEKRLNDITLYVHKENGAFVNSFVLSNSDLTSGRAIIQMPRHATGQRCTFIASANSSFKGSNGNVTKYLEESFCSKDNGAYNPRQASNALNGSGVTALPMTGMVEADISPFGYMSEVQIPLKMIMAKVAFEWCIDPDFELNHNGASVEIETVILDNAARMGYSFLYDTPRSYSESLVSLMQNPVETDGKFQNQWYLYQSSNNSSRPTIILTGTYDADGDPSTTHDRHTVTYSLPVDYIENKGVIVPNHVYRISAVIKGVDAENVSATWKVEDWDGFPINDCEIGI